MRKVGPTLPITVIASTSPFNEMAATILTFVPQFRGAWAKALSPISALAKRLVIAVFTPDSSRKIRFFGETDVILTQYS